MRTFLVFLDLPVHYEFRVHDMPLLPRGTEVEFDAVLKDPSDARLSKRVFGAYRVVRNKVRYSTTKPSRLGLTQYLEMAPAEPDAPPEGIGASKTAEGGPR
jgi:hypothetical protein